jgi:hypothetical protein
MLTKEQEPTEPWGEPIRPLALGPVSRHIPELVWVGALLFMCFSEALAIHGVWFKPQPHLDIVRRCEISVYNLLPSLMGFGLRIGIGRMSKVGQISLSAAEKLRSSLGIILFITNMVLIELTGIAFS